MKPRSLFFRSLVVCLVVACLPAAVSPGLAKARKAEKVEVLPDEGFPPLTDADRELTSVPFAPGAPAVALLDAEQRRWVERPVDGTSFTRVDEYRRIKILDPGALERWGTYEQSFSPSWRVTQVEARTILPDGSVIDAAESIRIDRSAYETGELQEESGHAFSHVFVSFPRVEVGAILDLHLSRRIFEAHGPSFFMIQGDLPILERRLLYFPPQEIRSVTTPTLRLVEGEGVAYEIENVWGNGFGWSFRNVKPLRDEAHRPSSLDLAKLIFILPSYGKVQELTDWREWGRSLFTDWTKWKKKSRREGKILAQEATKGATSTIEKIESIHKALRERVRLLGPGSFPSKESVDALLLHGSGTTADFAGTLWAMLETVDIESEVVLLRRRGRGSLPDFPFRPLLQDAVLRVKTEQGPIWVSPGEAIPAGSLRWDCYGVQAVAVRKVGEGLETIPEPAPEDHSIRRDVELSIDASGNLAGRATITYAGLAAHRWRDWLRNVTSADARNEYEAIIQTAAPSASLDEMKIRDASNPAEPLQVELAWNAPNHAVVAAGRVVVAPILLGQSSADGWPEDERHYRIELGHPYLVEDRVTLRLPEGHGEVVLPDAIDAPFPQVGHFELEFREEEGAVIIERSKRLEWPSFPASSYDRLREWFTAMAEADRRAVVFATP